MAARTTTAAGRAMAAAMTEGRPAKKPRWSRGKIRALAYTSGLLTFVAGLGVLGYAPRPATAESASGKQHREQPRRLVIVRHITRKVVIVDPPAASAPVYYAPSYSGGSTSSSSTSVSNPAPPPPPPAPTTGGSHP
jgi:hypothetical protein